MLKKFLLIPMLFALCACTPQEGPGIEIKGAVSKPGTINEKALKGLNRYHRLVKLADDQGNFLGSLELSGYALKDVLDRAEITKQDDGFNKPLDLYITARGSGGHSALFSYGECFLTNDEGILLADSARVIMPHRHPSINAGEDDPAVLVGIKKRDSINLEGCAECHDGYVESKLYFPKGWMLVAANDRFNGRYIENLAEISVNQVGIEVEDTRRSGGRDSIIESPAIIGPDGVSHEFKLVDFQKLPRVLVEEVGVGLGTGYRGPRNWEGVPLNGLLKHLLPDGVDPKSAYVLVTGADGYRSVFSGMEVFNAPIEKCVLLADLRDGKAMDVGAGRFTIIQRSDFYLDRNVRMAKEIRLVVPD